MLIIHRFTDNKKSTYCYFLEDILDRVCPRLHQLSNSRYLSCITHWPVEYIDHVSQLDSTRHLADLNTYSKCLVIVYKLCEWCNSIQLRRLMVKLMLMKHHVTMGLVRSTYQDRHFYFHPKSILQSKHIDSFQECLNIVHCGIYLGTLDIRQYLHNNEVQFKQKKTTLITILDIKGQLTDTSKIVI